MTLVLRGAAGYEAWTEFDYATKKHVKVREEADCFTCSHCNRVVTVKAKEDPTEVGGRCKHCMQYVCKACAGVGICLPFLEKIEAMERRYELRRMIDRGG